MRLSVKLLIAALVPLFIAACSPQEPTGLLETLGGRPLTADLTGAAEVPSPGDTDGSGTAWVTLNQGLAEVCFVIEVADIATPTAAHIHDAPAGVASGVVVNFDLTTNGLSGCVDADADLIKAIRQAPWNYYVNVHNADFPPGAVRGQLSK